MSVESVNYNVGRCVIIELSDITDADLSLIGNALSRVLSLHYSLVSCERIHCFRLDLIDFAITTVIPFQTIKRDYNAFAKIRETLENLSQNSSNNLGRMTSSIGKSIASFNSVRNIRQSMQQLLQQIPPLVALVDITYITGRQHRLVVRDLCEAIKQLDVTRVSKVNLFCIHKKNPIHNNSENSLEELIPFDLKSLIQTHSYVCNELTLEGYFKAWFHESNYQTEKLQIVFANNDSNCIIKCDLKEAIIDANLISSKPIDLDLTIGNRSKTVMSSILSSNGDNSSHNSIYKLRVCGLVDSTGLCESVLFGMPYFVTPTRCIEMNYELFEQNVQHFNALINVMINRKVNVLLESCEPSSAKAFFALCASRNNKSLIIKSIATRELVLPNSLDSIDNLLTIPPSPQVMTSIEKQFNYYKSSNYYNPLYVQSGLYNYLNDVIHENND